MLPTSSQKGLLTVTLLRGKRHTWPNPRALSDKSKLIDVFAAYYVCVQSVVASAFVSLMVIDIPSIISRELSFTLYTEHYFERTTKQYLPDVCAAMKHDVT